MDLTDMMDEDIKALEVLHKATGTTRYVYPAFGIDLGFPDQKTE